MEPTTITPPAPRSDEPGELLDLDAADSAARIEQTEQEPHMVIRPSEGWRALDLRQIWQFRDLLVTLAQRDVKLRYRQTALGAVWVILQPLFGAGIFSFVFGGIAQLPSGEVPYLVFAFTGLLCWNLFNNTLNKTSNVLVANAHLVSKVYFPRLILPISTVYSSLIDFGVALGVMGVLMVIFHIVPTLALLTLPLWIAVTILLSVGCGLYLSALMVSYRDVGIVVPVIVNFLFFLSPLLYELDTILERVGGKLSPAGLVWLERALLANPMAGLLQAFRWSLSCGEAPVWGAVIYSTVVALVAFVAGAFAFRRMEKKFADVI